MISMLVVVAVVANILVMVCIAKEKRLRRPANYYVFSLALNDFIIALVPITLLLFYDMFQRWPFGPIVCKVRDSYLPFL